MRSPCSLWIGSTLGKNKMVAKFNLARVCVSHFHCPIFPPSRGAFADAPHRPMPIERMNLCPSNASPLFCLQILSHLAVN